MSTLDQTLIQKYKQMVGFGNIQNISNNTTLFGNTTISSNLFVTNNVIFYSNTSIGSNILVSSNTNILGNVSINNLLTVSGNTIINGNTSILSNLYISNNSNIYGNLIVNNNSIFTSNVTMNSSLYISSNAYLQNSINLTTIQPITNTLSINGNIINIGNSNSIIKIIGSSNYVASNNLNIIDKVVSLNLNASTASGFDIGNLSGIEILGTNGNGYIKTDITATRFEIKPPLNNSGYITILDLNNNLSISGTAIFQNNITNLSSLNILGNSNIKGFATINNNLNVSNNTVIQGSITINSNLFISNNSIIQGLTTMNSNLNISGNSLLLGTATIFSNLLISTNTIINNNLTINSLLNISNNLLINNNTSINSSLYINTNAIINGSSSINNSLTVFGNTILNNVSITSNLYVTNNTTINGNVSYNSNLNISGNTIIQGNTTVGSYFTLLGQMIMNLTEYSDNATAKLGGIPIWGFYRTGGIIKIRLNDTLPIITLNGPLVLNVNVGIAYSDPGASALDYLNNSIPVYFSINNGSSILISGISTLITQTSALIVGSYTATYTATDSYGLIGLNYRSINIINASPIASLQFNSSNQYFTRLFATNNSKQWTISIWLNCNTTTAYQSIISSYRSSGGYQSGLIYKYNSYLRSWALNVAGSGYDNLACVNMISSNNWIHVVIIYDSTQSIGSNRYKCYYNNVLQTNTGTYAPPAGGNVSLNEILYEFTNPTTFYIGNRNPLDSQYVGYMSQFVFVDNQALTPSSFGYLNSNSQWAVQLYSGTFGPCGYYLNFSNSSNVGLDSSGNNNHWVATGLSSSNINYSNLIPQ